MKILGKWSYLPLAQSPESSAPLNGNQKNFSAKMILGMVFTLALVLCIFNFEALSYQYKVANELIAKRSRISLGELSYQEKLR